MSIVKLLKVTIYGHAAKKEQTLADLQEMGCLHILPLKDESALAGGGPTVQAREALKFLLSSPQKRKQVRRYRKFDPKATEENALRIQEQLRKLEDERDFLLGRINRMRLWGDFEFSSLEEMQNLRLWFYQIPHNDMKKLDRPDLIWQVVNRDNSFCYLTVVSKDEPKDMPVERAHLGGMSLHLLEEKLDEVEFAIEDVKEARFNLSRWCFLFAENLYKLENDAELEKVKYQTLDTEPLFALQGWIAKARQEEIKKYAEEKQLALSLKEPTHDESPPTFFHNVKAAASGEDLVKFYMTPNYWLWDPSSVVFYSFCLFFAMILSDAAYGVVLGLIILLFWKKMSKTKAGRRLRTLFTGLVISTIAWGMLVGSYFGVTPPKDSLLGKIHILSLHDFTTMMGLSVVIGVVHILIANIMNARRNGEWRWEALAPIGWAFMILGGFLFGCGQLKISIAHLLGVAGKILGSTGLVLVIFFTSSKKNIFKRILSGLLGLTKITQAFGDVLSYLRLFALGLASASLAISFNGLAHEVMAADPGIGVLFAFFIFLIGHVLNFLLSLLSGFVHGLRLNMIEFFNWGIAEEGRPFKAFKRKEEVSWNS